MAIIHTLKLFGFTILQTVQNVYHNWDMPEEEEEE